MNINFNKALYQLDRGMYDEAEKNIIKAIDESTNKYELIQIKCCYAELLYELERYDEALKCADFILENTDEFYEGFERETAIDIKNSIERI